MEVKQDYSGGKWQIRIYKRMKSIRKCGSSGFIYDSKEDAEDDKDLFKWFYSQQKARTPNLPNPDHNWKTFKPGGVEWDNNRQK